MKKANKVTRPLKSYDLKIFSRDEVVQMEGFYRWNKFRLSDELLKALKENRDLKETVKQLRSQVSSLQMKNNTADHLFNALNEICDEQRALIGRLHDQSGSGMMSYLKKHNPRLRIVT